LQHTPQSRPLDALAIVVVVGLCLTWGFNQVAIKFALHGIPPLTQSAARSAIAALCVAAYAQMRGIPLFKRDGTLWAGIAAGILFAVEFLLVYRGLVWTTATRGVLFLYAAPFFVVIGSRLFIPGDRFYPLQWFGLTLSFIGIVIAFGLPTPAADPRQRMDAVPSALAIASFAYQALWVVSVSFVIWFALIIRYSANRLSAFTFLTPIFGVAAGHLVLNEPLTPAFALAVGLVAAGLVLVNRPR
jgi:drug/metabolite transporter (DMT)-like permease